MVRQFNVTAVCRPELHYMVDITGRLKQIEAMVDRGDYFTMNRARQYGKTTTLRALASWLREKYVVVSLDFQKLDSVDFSDNGHFSQAFARECYNSVRKEECITDSVSDMLKSLAFASAESMNLSKLFFYLSDWCEQSPKPVVLIIDEVDTASNYQVFLDFLAQLRAGYIDRDITPTFQSVILAGVYDIKNLKHRFVPDGQHKTNSPWNIAADYLVDMSFSVEDISGMLLEYEEDHGTGMNIRSVSELIYDYTSGYPFLVSRICKLIDEQIMNTDQYPDKISAWSKAGVVEAVSRILNEKNMLFESLLDKVESYPELKALLYTLLMNGKDISYNPDNEAIDIAMMFGFLKVVNNKAVVANRIFETRLYNMFLTSPEMQGSKMYTLGDRDKYQFVKEDSLDMKLILERFVVSFEDIYGDQMQNFLEEDGRRYFLLYLRPIINGTGNYYIESRTRNQERTDVIIDYCGIQYVIEMKIWHGNAYNERGEKQLMEYLDAYHLRKGYMLSFNFNQKKEVGVKEVRLGDKILVEAVV